MDGGTGGIYQYRYQSYPLPEKFGWVHDSRGANAVEPAAHSLDDMSGKLAGIGDESTKQMNGLSLSWSGPAAGSAQDSLAQTVRSLDRTSDLGKNGAERIRDYGRSYETMRRSVSFNNPDNYNWLARFADTTIEMDLRVWGLGDDHVSIDESNQVLDDVANRALEQHETNARRAEAEFVTAGDEPPRSPGPAPGGGRGGGGGGTGRSGNSHLAPADHPGNAGPGPGTASAPGSTPPLPADGTAGTQRPGPGPDVGITPWSTGGGSPQREGPDAPGTRRPGPTGPGRTDSGDQTDPQRRSPTPAPRNGGTSPDRPRTVGPSTGPGTQPSEVDGGTDPTGRQPWNSPNGPGTGTPGFPDDGGPTSRTPGPDTVGPWAPRDGTPSRTPSRNGPQFGRDLQDSRLVPGGPGRGRYDTRSPRTYGGRTPLGDGERWSGSDPGRELGRTPAEDGFRSGERSVPRSGTGPTVEGGRPVAEPGGPGSRTGVGAGYAPMAGFGGGRGDGREHRNRYQLTDSEAFEIDVVCSPAVLGPADDDGAEPIEAGEDDIDDGRRRRQ